MFLREAKESDIKIQETTTFFSVTVEADEEMKESEKSRGLVNDEKTERPSEVMSSFDKGLSTLANLMTDEVNM